MRLEAPPKPEPPTMKFNESQHHQAESANNDDDDDEQQSTQPLLLNHNSIDAVTYPSEMVVKTEVCKVQKKCCVDPDKCADGHIRKPFHYPPDLDNIGQYKYGTFCANDDDGQQLVTNDANAEDAMPIVAEASHASSIYTRYRYYNRLFNRSITECNEPTQVVRIPDHVIPWYFRIPKISVPNFEVPEDDKQSSIVTIFAIWNMMMGTSLLSLPWAYHHAGLIGGILVIFFMTSICFYTASLVISVPKIVSVQVQEFTDIVALLLGRLAHKISQISSLSILTGGCIVYWILMTNFLRHIVSFVYQVQFMNVSIGLNASSVVCTSALTLGDSDPDTDSRLFFQVLDYAVPAILVCILGPIMCLKSVSIFLRFNIVGTLSVFFLLGFAFFKAYHWGFVHLDWSNPDSPFYVQLFSWNFPIYTGVLSLALFIHNCLTTLMRTQKNPANNQRDLAIAYILVGVTYLLISTAIYISFPLDKDCIRDNFLDNLESNDLFAFITRLFLLLQVVTLFPLLVYMLRVQVLGMFQDHATGEVSNQAVRILALNSLLLVCCILFATYYPQIGSVIRYCGSFSGLILIFTLPPLTYLRAREMIKRPIQPILFVLLCLIVLFGLINFIAQFLVQT